MRKSVKSAPPPGGDPTEFIMSDSAIDRMGDVVVAEGWDLKHFKAQPIALFNHDPNQVIGKWSDVRIEGKQLRGRLELAAAGTSPLVDTVRALVDQKILRAVSVGFRPIEKQKLTKDADDYFGPFRFLKSELLECSLVAVPANPRALSAAKSLALSGDTLAEVFRMTAEARPAPNAKPGTSSDQSRTITMTLSQRIQAAQKRINSLRDQITDLANKNDLADEEMKLADELPDMLEAEQKDLARWEKMEKAAAPREGSPKPAAPAIHGEIIPPGQPIILPRKKLEPVDFAFRAMAVSIKSFGSQAPLDTTLRDMYGNDEGTQMVLRAAVNPAMTTVAGYAAELVQTANGALLDRLIGNSLYGPLAAAGSRFDFGRNGQMKIPVRANTPKASGQWVGEGSPKPVKKIGLTSVTLSPHKLAVITTFSEEMAFYSTPAIEGILRKAMEDDTREALDGFLIDNVAASASRPAGLLNGVSPITAASSGTILEKMVADINALIAPMEAAGGGGNVVLLMNPAQARRVGMAQTSTGDFAFDSTAQAASKFGVSRIIASTIVPAGTVIAVDADWFTTATGDTPRFAVSNEATLHEEDTSPQPLSAVGSPNTVAAPMRSLFQTDSIAIRLSLYVTWSMVRSSMVQTVNSVGW